MLSKKIGIDLGTASLTVFVKGEGVVLAEPALVAMDQNGGRVLAVGSAASDLLGRGAPARAVRPMKGGTLVDYQSAGALLHHSIGRVCGRQRIFRPDVMLSVPLAVTGVERRAVLEATMQAGARTAYLIEKPLAAALGAHVPIATTPGVLVCHIGAGTTEAAVIAMGEMVAATSTSTGGTQLDAAIADMVAVTHGLRLDATEAERVKLEIGSAEDHPAGSIDVSGQDAQGRPTTVAITAPEVRQAIGALLDGMTAMLARVLDQAPPEVQPEVRRAGVVLTGGGAQLRGLAPFLSARLAVPVQVAAHPQVCVAVGTGMALDNLQIIRRGQHYIG
jgi:rod shape-determining protein MreB